MSDKITVKALSPIRYGTADEEVKTYEPGDTFQVLATEAKQLVETGAVEVSEDVAKQLDEVPSTDPAYTPVDVPAQPEPVAAPEASATEAPLVQVVPTQTAPSGQPTAQEISATLDSLK